MLYQLRRQEHCRKAGVLEKWGATFTAPIRTFVARETTLLGLAEEYVASASTGTIVYGLVSRPPLLRGPAELASSRRPRHRAQGQLDAEMACIRCDTRLPSRSRRTEHRRSPVARSPIAKRSCSKAPGHVWAGEASEYDNGTCGQHAQNSRVSALLISAR